MTTKALTTYEHGDMKLRAIDIDGEFWFVAADAVEALGLTGYASKHTRKLDADERRVLSPSDIPNGRALGKRNAPSATAVSESGLYKLIMRSDKPAAKRFQNWVTQEVLPDIRMTSGYVLNEAARETAAVATPEGQSAMQLFAAAFQKMAEEQTELKAEVVHLREYLEKRAGALPAPKPRWTAGGASTLDAG